jgi:hypothetical protein
MNAKLELDNDTTRPLAFAVLVGKVNDSSPHYLAERMTQEQMSVMFVDGYVV